MVTVWRGEGHGCSVEPRSGDRVVLKLNFFGSGKQQSAGSGGDGLRDHGSWNTDYKRVNEEGRRNSALDLLHSFS
jgi:hypothetical protein